MLDSSNSNLKGAVAEQAIALAATRLGIPVFKPVAEHGRCDLVFDIAGGLRRVQCKWGRLTPARDAVAVAVGAHRVLPPGIDDGPTR